MSELRLKDILNKCGKYALVGMNSQGKTYAIEEFYKAHKKTTIYIENEVRADEALKNTTNSSPLVEWLERLLDLKKVKSLIDNQLDLVDLSDVNKTSNLTIKLVNTVSNFKGLISTQIETDSNQWKLPGSGETFLGELLMVEQMIEMGKKNPIKCLIIDEPETFLHESLYVSVCAILRRLSKKLNVVISTHSSVFIKNYCDDFYEIIFVKNGCLNQLMSDDEYIDLLLKMDLYKKYTDNMDRNTQNVLRIMNDYFKMFTIPKLFDCLFCEIAVLGEGFAEQELFNCYKKHYELEKNIGSICFSVVSGKYLMPMYIYLLSQIGITTVAIFDSDKKNNENPWNNAVNNTLIKYSNSTYIFEEDIEKYLGITKESKKDTNYKTVFSPLQIELLYLEKSEKILKLMDELKEKINISFKVKEET